MHINVTKAISTQCFSEIPGLNGLQAFILRRSSHVITHVRFPSVLIHAYVIVA